MSLVGEGDRLGHVLVCPPEREYTTASDRLAQNLPEAADRDTALAQHAALVRTLEETGARVTSVPELGGHPNSVFVRDAALATPVGFVELRMGLPARRGEERWMARHLGALGLAPLGRVVPPGTVEGGDVFLLEGLALVGISSRTNAEGARQLARLLETVGYRVRTAAIPPPLFHLGSVLSPVGRGRVLAVEGALPADFLVGLEVVVLPARAGEAATANVVHLGDGEVIVDAGDGSGAGELLARRGARVHALDLSEFRKGAGGPTCLTLPVSREG